MIPAHRPPSASVASAYGALVSHAADCASPPDAARAALVRLRGSEPWHLLLSHASDTGLLSLAVRVAGTLPPDSLPSSVIPQLDAHRRRSSTARARQDRVYEALAEWGHIANATPVVFKGRVHEALLGQRAQRLRADVDLMVPAAGRVRLARFLHARGWLLIGGTSHRGAIALGCGWLALAGRHDHWWHPRLGDLEIHSRVTNDLRRREWTHSHLIPTSCRYVVRGIPFTGPDPRTTAGLAVWNALQSHCVRHAALAEACALLKAHGCPPEVPPQAETVVRWLLGAAVSGSPVPSPAGASLQSRTSPSTPDSRAESSDRALQQSASDTWLAWANPRVSRPIRAVEAVRRRVVSLLP